jgi:hypothetical protein
MAMKNPEARQRGEKAGKDILETIAKIKRIQEDQRPRPAAARWNHPALRILGRKSLDGEQWEEVNYLFAGSSESYIRSEDKITVLTWASPWARLRHLQPGDDIDLKVPNGEWEVVLEEKSTFEVASLQSLRFFRGSGKQGDFAFPGEFPSTPFDSPIEEVPRARARTGHQGLRGLVLDTDREQDDLTRMEPRGLLVIEGPPGTGKSTVAIQRVAFLLNEETQKLFETGSFFNPESTAIFVRTNSLLRSMDLQLAELGVDEVKPKEFIAWRGQQLRRRGLVGERGQFTLRRRKDAEGPTEAWIKNSQELMLAFERFLPEGWSQYWNYLATEVEQSLEKAWRVRDAKAWSPPGKAPSRERESDRAEAEKLKKRFIESIVLAAKVAQEASPRSPSIGISEFGDQWLRLAPSAGDLTSHADPVWLGYAAALLVRFPESLGLARARARWEGHRKSELDSLIEECGNLPIALPFGYLLQAFAHSAHALEAVDQLDDPHTYRAAIHEWRERLGEPGRPGKWSENDQAMILLAIQRGLDDAPEDSPAWARPLERFSHVVIDEAQDFSLAELRVVTSLVAAPWKTVTLAGDLRQAVREDGGIRSWSDLQLHSSTFPPLKIGYRAATQLAAFTAGYYRSAFEEAPPFSGPKGPWEGGSVRTLTAAKEEIDDSLVREIVAYRDAEPTGTVVVFRFPADTRLERFELLQELLEDHGIQSRTSEAGNLLDPGIVHFSTPEEAKGMDFDAVFIVLDDPASFDEAAGWERRLLRNRLYVGLTRARRALTVLTCERWPEILEECDQWTAGGGTKPASSS